MTKRRVRQSYVCPDCLASLNDIAERQRLSILRALEWHRVAGCPKTGNPLRFLTT